MISPSHLLASSGLIEREERETTGGSSSVHHARSRARDSEGGGWLVVTAGVGLFLALARGV